MNKKTFAPSELIINEDGSIFHLHLTPQQIADKIMLVGDPGRVSLVASYFDENLKWKVASLKPSLVLIKGKGSRC